MTILRSFSRLPRLASCGHWVALPVLALGLRPAMAQTVVTPPAAATGTVAVLPAGPTRSGTPVIVASAVDTSGDADIAKRALGLANAALANTPGYAPMPTSEYAPLSANLAKSSMKPVDWSYPLTATDFQRIGKAGGTKRTIPRALTIAVSPITDGYNAVAELYDTRNGALVGYGRGTGTGENGLESAVSSAVVALGETATLNGIIVSKPSGNVARLSLGLTTGARGGARIEYLGDNGEPIAFGTIFDIAAGEALATVAPETAYPNLYVNGRVRLVQNPSAKRALPTAKEVSDREFAQFEKSFALSLGTAAAVYYLAIRD